MTTRSVKNTDELALLKTYLDGRKRPFTIEVTDGRDRSSEQNRLSQKWYAEISEQTGEDREDVRARCKLEHGVPLLRKANEKFREVYNRTLLRLTYDEKRDFIRYTDMPVTRLLSVTDMSQYMDEVFRRHAEAGIVLTIPPDRYAYAPNPTLGRQEAAA